MNDSTFIKRVVLHNYKSIKECSVELGSLTFLVGPNGAGKSNFLDALRLVKESLDTTFGQAIGMRAGAKEVRRRSFAKRGKKGKGRPTNFGVRVDFNLGPKMDGSYAFQVGARANGVSVIEKEECRWTEGGALDKAWYVVKAGEVVSSSERAMPVVASDQLYLLRASSIPTFRPIYDALSRMGFYNLNPDAMRELQTPAVGEVLKRDGANLASVLDLLGSEAPDARKRILEFLACVVPGVKDVAVRHLAPAKKEMLLFKQEVVPNETTWEFMAESMSDGTLRALGVLTALFQSRLGNSHRVPLVGIEEPEAALHPGAAGALRDALIAASANTQVIVTCHSPDLLDDKDINADWILGVAHGNGETRIAPIDEADRSVLRDRLFTAGELLKKGQLGPDPKKLKAVKPEQLELFGRNAS
jgi:predicted ATPase